LKRNLFIFQNSLFKPFCEVKNLNIRGNLKKLPVTINKITATKLNPALAF